MAAPSWRDLDDRRAKLRKPMSRAEWSRLAGISESTITKGVGQNKRPRKAQRIQSELVLSAAEVAAEETERQMGELGETLQQRLAS